MIIAKITKVGNFNSFLKEFVLYSSFLIYMIATNKKEMNILRFMRKLLLSLRANLFNTSGLKVEIIMKPKKHSN
jgi:hypothetical protein